MKNKFSFLSCCVLGLVFITTRLIYTDTETRMPLKVTAWDGLGYYLYLPSNLIYHNDSTLSWFPAIDSQYNLSGGVFYQAALQKNHHYVFKYLMGVSILQAPFFALAHVFAQNSQFPADGFSMPYQYAVAWGALFYCLLALFVLRKILLRYYSDITVAITLALLILASNAIQYIAVDSGLSHAYIFPLYVFILYTTIQWHEKRNIIWAFATGLIIGLATISRPTEAIILFIPLLWDTHTKESVKEKKEFLKQHSYHILAICMGGLIAILPQLLYWKKATGSYLYDVGSKWDFLNPHFRVLFGWEKGWFIYTPIAVFFIIGLFFIKYKAFGKSVLIFCLLNIYIIIAWHTWRYGGSYSCRALVQSYPLFAFPLAAFIERSISSKWKYVWGILGLYLIFANLFQIKQYNRNIIHYDDMNRLYYSSIYLNSNPTALDMSLLDTKDIIHNEKKYLTDTFTDTTLNLPLNNGSLIWQNSFVGFKKNYKELWLKVDAAIISTHNIWNAYLVCTIQDNNLTTTTKIRLYNPISKDGQLNKYSFFVRIPCINCNNVASLNLLASNDYRGQLKYLCIKELWR